MSNKLCAGLTALGIVLLASPTWAQATWGPTSMASTTVTLLPTPPATITGSGNYASNCTIMKSRGFSVFGALSGAGTLAVQRYADTACVNPVTTGLSTDPSNALALTTGGGCPSASHCGTVASNDSFVYQALIVTLTDTSSSTNTIVALQPTIGTE